MNDGAVTCDVANVYETVDAPRGKQQATTTDRTRDDGDIVLVDTRGQQINPLPTRMTVAETLEDALGPR